MTIAIVLGTGSTKFKGWRRCEMRRVLVVLIAAVLVVGCTVEQQQAGAKLLASLNPTQQVLLATVAPAILVSAESKLVVASTPVSAQANATPASAAALVNAPDPLESVTTGNWEVSYYTGVTDQMRGWGRDLKDLVTDWSEFPNVDFPKYNFLAKDGVEYGMAESAYCQQSQTCDVNVPAMHYRLVTGDYNIPGIDECSFDNDKAGCGIALFNVGVTTAMFRGSKVDYGFTVEGRYWNGDVMATTIWALMSNTAYNMLNKESNVNMGANCSSPDGCAKVRLTVVVLSGNQLLMKAVTIVNR